MPVISARSPIKDLNTVATVTREVFGAEAIVVDKGMPGALDHKDVLVRSQDGATVTAPLGVKRSEEIAFRSHVVIAAKALAASGASFSGSADADKVNPALWTMGYGGRIQVRKFMPDGSFGKPSDALRDIFSNGKAYGFECATAMMVIYHKAILDHVGDDAFNKMFSEPKNLAFFRWSVEDEDFTDVKELVYKPMPLQPGSHYYYKNPDAAPENSAFAGENVLYLGNGQFYAHGIVGAEGTYLVTERELISWLSKLRKPDATTKPFRVDMAMWLDGYALSRKAFPDGIPGT
jgi:Protein-glutamine gamma-glutamyltransferase